MLSCSCEFDIEIDEPFHYIPKEFVVFKKLRRKRCISCAELIEHKSECVEFKWQKQDESGNEIEMASTFMCGDCGEKYLNLTSIGYCIDLGENMEYYMEQYRTLDESEKAKKGIKNLITIPEDKQPDNCKGLVFKLNINSYLSSYSSIETRKSLRLLKRKSCPGCEKCDWIWDHLQEDISCCDNDFLNQLDDNFEYKIVVNSSYNHWSGEHECELEFKKI